MSSRLLATALLVAVPVLSACGSETSTPDTTLTPTAELTIATAFYPITEIVERVSAGTSIEIVGLTPPGVGAHDHELTARQLDDLTQVDAVFYLGGGIQPSVEKAVKQLGGSVAVVNLMDHAQTITSAEKSTEEEDDDHNHDDHGDTDPHVWLDPANMASMTQAVISTLAGLSADLAATFEDNGSTYIAELTTLGKELDTAFMQCVSRALVTSHDAFGYFAARAKLDTVPIAGVDPANEPSAQQLEEIARSAKNAQASTVFFETQLPDGLAKTIASSIGANVSVIDPIETISSADLNAGKNYLSIQRKNIASIAKGLRCSS